jgi:TonB-linked SusC/RagA family outer membrane protein
MKRLLYNLIIPCLLTMGFVQANAQRTISGTVTSASDGEPLLGATVLVKGTSVGTVTDFDGTYQIEASDVDVLVVSYTGYTQIEVPVGANSTIDITMSEASEILSEVVVVGYSAQQKKDLTGAVGVVDAEELKTIPSSNITSQLQGRVSGVTISGDGRPGQPAKVRIRGFASFSGANDPLYVVDGVPTQDISTLNPNDIENISVLKDAGAASIYGSRASNGVILITTKQGTNSGVKVSYDAFVGVQDPGNGPENLLNTQGYADLQWLVYANDGTSETHPVYGPSSNARPSLPSWAANTDWYDVLTRQAMIMNHDLSFSGGNENATFYAGLNYFNQEGIVIENFAKRYSARLNSTFKIANGKITLGENLTVTGRSGNGVAGNGEEGGAFAMGVYRTQPIIPSIIESTVQGIGRTFQPGEYGGTGLAPRLGNGDNMLAQQTRNADDRQQDLRVLGSAFIDVQLMEGLNFRSTFGGTYQSGYNTNWTNATYESAENVATSSYNEVGYFNADWVWTNTLSYDKTFGMHSIKAVAGYESVKYGISRGVGASRAGYFSTDYAFRTVDNGSQITGANSNFNTPTTLVSTFARADYSYNNRYYLSGTVRRDGSSRFGSEFRYGVFPSVSAGIRVSDFLADNSDFLSDLKIRGGYGTMGNQLPVNPANQFSLFGGSPGSSFYDLNGSATSSLQGFRPTRIGNADSKWETQITTNIGFDAALFDSKMQISFDWYRKDAQDLLVTVPLPAIYGAASAPALNIGDMKNTGLDLQLDYRTDLTSDLSLDATLTFTTYKNEIVKYADGIDFFAAGGSRIGAFNRNEVGRSISEFFGYEVVGLFQNQAEVDAAPTQAGAEPGFFRYADIDGNGEITPNDRTFIGNPNPDFTYGLNLGLNYKNFNLTAFFFGSQGNEIFNYNKWWVDFWPSFQGQKSNDLLNNSWTPNNPGATVPKASNKSNFSTNTQSTSYYVEDGSFLRLRNLQLAYTIPSNVLQPIGISNLSVYVQGINLLTLTDYTGLDPDLNNGGDTSFGVDEGNYPLVKQYLFGLRMGF